MAPLKVTSFYGIAVPRPHVLLDEEKNPIKDRVEAPKVNDALIRWASRVPFKFGGSLVKPTWEGEAPSNARGDFAIFAEERMGEIVTLDPTLAGDRKSLMAVASEMWHKLSDAERHEYQERAKEEKQRAQERIAELEEEDPSYKAYREKESMYKKAITAINSAARAATGPLWRVQRRMNASLKQSKASAKNTTETDNVKPSRPAPKRKHKGLKNVIKKRAGAKLGLRSKKYKAIKAEKQAANVKVQKQQKTSAGSGPSKVTRSSARNAPAAPAVFSIAKKGKNTDTKRKAEAQPEAVTLRRRPRK